MRHNSFLILSGHDYRSKRRANIHFIAKELAQKGKTRFFSVGFSYLSKIKKDPRLSLWSLANKLGELDGVECYLWRSLFHPVNLRHKLLGWLDHVLFKLYSFLTPGILDRWIMDATTIVIESGMSVLFYDKIRRLNPKAKIIYVCSDALDTIGCSNFLIKQLRRVAPGFDLVRIPSRALISEFPAGCRLRLIPQGMDANNVASATQNPYGAGVHMVSVGSMLFDAGFFEIAAPACPDVHFHVIGAGRGADGLSAPNLTVYDEMPFKQTLPYIQHAHAGIAPYEGNKVSSYLVDTSMKLIQFEANGLPAACPTTVSGGKPWRLGYVPGDKQSIVNAIRAALAYGRFEGTKQLSWAEVTERVLNPEAYPDTRV